MTNLPDDWNTYYSRCEVCGERRHASGDTECACDRGEAMTDKNCWTCGHWRWSEGMCLSLTGPVIEWARANPGQTAEGPRDTEPCPGHVDVDDDDAAIDREMDRREDPAPREDEDEDWTDREPHEEAAYAAENLAAWLTPAPLDDTQRENVERWFGVLCGHLARLGITPKEQP